MLFSAVEENNIRDVVGTEAPREILWGIMQDYVREGMMIAVANSIKKIIPSHMLDARLKKFAIKL